MEKLKTNSKKRNQSKAIVTAGGNDPTRPIQVAVSHDLEALAAGTGNHYHVHVHLHMAGGSNDPTRP